MLTIILCVMAGLGAGVGTGLAGLSAAAVIAPMLIAFLNISAYEAITIALASDVLASAVSAFTYGKNKNIDVKNGSLMLTIVLFFTIIGSVAGYIASSYSDTVMGGFSIIMTFFLGLKFLVCPVETTKEGMVFVGRQRLIKTVLSGVVIGCICGFMGAGGGMMMLLMLTTVLGYELKMAVGTSVFIMTFTALTGAVSHVLMGGSPDIKILFWCMIFTLVGARMSARFANRTTTAVMNRAIGSVLTILGVIMIGAKYFW